MLDLAVRPEEVLRAPLKTMKLAPVTFLSLFWMLIA